ncbi:MAG: polysaccharide deacetylase family protein [Candidatus Aureabacteria bacterium]|nr:polysaccharide deacetylase family protein [Candidatus Auribacterota bacterium]
MGMLNAFTIDVEDWFHVCDVDNKESKFDNWNKCENRVVDNTLLLLKILREHDTKATFFFLGWVAEKHPELVRKVSEDGHEIATHGYAHKLIYEQTPEEFSEDLKKSVNILEGIITEKVIGHRGAGFSIREDSLWALKIIAECGLKYDSTIFPAKRGHGGLESAESYPYLMDLERNLRMWEFPMSVAHVFGRKVPFSGGGYLRLFPYWFVKRSIGLINKRGKPAIVYIHPREIDIKQPRMKLPLSRKFKYYVNLKTAEAKIKALLADFEFASVKKVLKL